MAENIEDLDIKCEAIVVTLCFHPNQDILAGGKLDGNISLWHRNDSGIVTNQKELTHHSKACRAVAFSASGNDLYSISKDKSLQIFDLNVEKVSKVIRNTHSCAPYCLEIIDPVTLATGDDDGNVKVWDLRCSKAMMEMNEMEEYVSSLTFSNDKKSLIATSGEGTLTAYNIRAKRLEMQSELFETEFLCGSFVKGGKKFVVGCEDGVINIFNNKEWGNISDRFPGHKTSVDRLTAINDKLICTASMDGIIRAVSILPNRIIGIVGEHESPIEDLALSNDGTVLASCCHNQVVKFWNVKYLDELKIKHKKKGDKLKSLPQLQSSRKQDFFSDLKNEFESAE